MQREFPLVIRKGGNRFVPTFPVDLEEEDQFIIVKEMKGSEVPKGKKWTVIGYSSDGPAVVSSDA